MYVNLEGSIAKKMLNYVYMFINIKADYRIMVWYIIGIVAVEYTEKQQIGCIYFKYKSSF